MSRALIQVRRQSAKVAAGSSQVNVPEQLRQEWPQSGVNQGKGLKKILLKFTDSEV